MNACTPLVSVCIPTRDRAVWLGEALDSVLGQTLTDLEVIVSDDASTDGTVEIVALRDDPRIRLLRQRRRLGVAANRNACLAAARGRHVAWLDSDDTWRPRMLETQVAILEENPEVAMVHGAFHVVDGTGRRLPDWPRPFDGDTLEPGPAAFRELVLENHVGAPTVVVRRSAHEAVGPYSPSLESAEDWEMWLRIALHGDVAWTAEPVARYRWHAGSLSRAAEESGAQLGRELRVVRRVLASHRDRIPDAEAVEAEAGAALAARALVQGTDRITRGDGQGALSRLLLALRARPGLARQAATWRLVRSVVGADEYGWHVESRALVGELAQDLEGTRFGDRLRRRVAADPGWEETLRRVARRVRDVVPAAARVAVVDKWDPTVLHLSGRRGWHFPDRRRMPDGYPPDDGAAVRHLEELQGLGAAYLVFPCSAFWWLEHYPGLRRHLEATGRRVVDDEVCRIYRLVEVESSSCAA